MGAQHDIAAGELDQLCALETPLERIEHGNVVQGWATVAQVWAKVEPLSGRELELLRQVHAEASHRVTIRWLDGVRPNMRLLLGGRALDIVALVDPRERHAALVLICAEQASAAA